jgi:acetylglutamate kinase
MMRVVKVGGRAQGDPALIPALVAAWRVSPGSLVVVHGGGDEVSALQRALGGEPQFHGGRRVTTAAELDVVRMVLSGTVNKRLTAALREANAVGISGEDAGLIEAAVVDSSLGRVGHPVRVNPAILARLLTGGFLPVVSPLAREFGDAGGAGLNVNGDDAASALAVSIFADELLLLVDVAGVIDRGTTVRALGPDAARALIDSGVAGGGMAAKLQAACTALEGGVARVRIGDLSAITNPDAGTLLTFEPTTV